MTDRATLRTTFDIDAARYDRTRPTYPAALFADLTALAALPRDARILEIGPGTGQATQTLAANTAIATIDAIELGESLAAYARKKFADDDRIAIHSGPFEAFEPAPGTRYDLIVAATSFHWIDPDARSAKTADLLADTGALAVIDTSHVGFVDERDDFFNVVQRCYEEHMPGTPPGMRLAHPDTIVDDVGDELLQSDRYAHVARRRYLDTITYSTAEYLDVISTYSGHIALAPDQRDALLGCIANLIDTRFDGKVTKRYLFRLLVAHRRPRQQRARVAGARRKRLPDVMPPEADQPDRRTALDRPATEPAGEVAPPGRELVHLRPAPEDPYPIEADRRSDVDHWGRSEHMREVARRIYDPMYKHWFRVEWEGFEHLPTDGGALLVGNHSGAIPSDAPVIMHGVEERLGRPIYGLAENLFRAVPFIGTMWSRLGGVPAHPDNAYRLLHDEEQLVLVFPEGTKGTGKHFTERYQLRRFGRGGFIEIAMRAGVPVIPVAVVGSEEAMPIVWKFNRLAKVMGIPYFPVTANMLLLGPVGLVGYFPAKFRVRVLPPVHFDVPPNQERYSRARVMDEAERVRMAIQEALYDMLRTRRSVWFG